MASLLTNTRGCMNIRLAGVQSARSKKVFYTSIMIIQLAWSADCYVGPAILP